MARDKPRRWIGIDGEGVGRKPHRYVLLACSDGDYIERREGLGTRECLDYLLALGGRDARVCGYYLSYDWTMILRDLPDLDIYQLFRPELRVDGTTFARVSWHGYKLHWLGGAMWIQKGKRRVTVWDLGKFCQSPFVDALDNWKLAPDVREQIAVMKKRRSLFTWRERTRIREYCLSECRALGELATALEAAHDAAELTPRAWHGPGSTAGALLARHSIDERRGHIPKEVGEAARVAYFGGRAEISCNGFVKGPVYGYDISSAYPYHASRLPCLEHGQWAETTCEADIATAAHAVVRGHVEHSRGDWGALPVRLSNGSIVFPLAGASGWWWRDEWQSARAHWPGLRFERAYTLHTTCDCKPFAFLPEVFTQRLAVGKETGAGKILKLAMNSVYGKLAQTVGGGKYASRVWAGMLTAATRAQVLDLLAAHTRQDSVLMIATDGLFSTELHSADYDSDTKVGAVKLGGWERCVYPEGMTLVRPGIYATGNKLRARGLGRDNLNEKARKALSDGLAQGAERVILAPRTAFGGAKSMVYATAAGAVKRSKFYGQWHEIPTCVSISPAPKRTSDWSPPRLAGVDSTPYGEEGAKNTKLLAILQLLRELMD